MTKSIVYSLLGAVFPNRDWPLPLTLKPAHIAVFRYDAIGDMLVTLPLLALIRKTFPHSHITAVVSGRNIDVAKACGFVDSAVQLDTSSYRDAFATARAVRSIGPVDLVINCVMNKTTFPGVLANLIGGKNVPKMMIANAERNHLYKKLFPVSIPVERASMPMAVMQQLMFARAFGLGDDVASEEFRLHLPEPLVDGFSKKLPPSGKKRLAVNLSARDAYRQWPLDSFLELFERMINRPSFSRWQCVILCMPAEQQMAETIAGRWPEFVVIAPATKTIVEAMAVVSLCDAVLTPDTSIIHVASVLGKPVVGMYSRLSSFSDEWRPWGVPQRVLITRTRTGIAEEIHPRDVENALCDLLGISNREGE